MLAGLGGAAAPASAQVFDRGIPVYRTWQADWDHGRFDRRHVILGEVAHAAPYRVDVVRRNGRVQTVDLKNGTVIVPLGATPQPGERVALVGYYSRGTFIVNRLVIR